eukprot:6214772-Pleurochrysis_carterae.AAC.4
MHVICHFLVFESIWLEAKLHHLRHTRRRAHEKQLKTTGPNRNTAPPLWQRTSPGVKQAGHASCRRTTSAACLSMRIASLLVQVILQVDVGRRPTSVSISGGDSPSLTLTSTPRTVTRWRRQRANERAISSPHPPSPLDHFSVRVEHGRSSEGAERQEERASRPAPEFGDSIGSTRLVGLEDLEGRGSWLRQEHTPSEDLGACRRWAPSNSSSAALTHSPRRGTWSGGRARP